MARTDDPTSLTYRPKTVPAKARATGLAATQRLGADARRKKLTPTAGELRQITGGKAPIQRAATATAQTSPSRAGAFAKPRASQQAPGANPTALQFQQPKNSIVVETGDKAGQIFGPAGRNSAGVGQNSGYLINPEGTAQYALDQFGRANEIRAAGAAKDLVEKRETGKVIVLDTGEKRGADELFEESRQALGRARSGNDLGRNSLAIRESESLAEQATLAARRAQNQDTVGGALTRNQATIAGALGREGVTQEGALGRARIASEDAQSRTAADNAALEGVRGGQAAAYLARAEALINGTPSDNHLTVDDLPNLATFGVIELNADGSANTDDPRTAEILLKITQGYANGGLVQHYEDGGMVQNFAEGGPVSALGRATPAPPSYPALQAYQAYASGSQAMGLPPVGFEEFSQMQQGATAARAGAAGQGPIGFADGGEVPDPSVSGKMVVDTDPATNGDTIPAMIDGEQPAALKSGEFVIPDDVVMFFGTDKLNKMIAQARKPADGGSDTAANGPTALTGAGTAPSAAPAAA